MSSRGAAGGGAAASGPGGGLGRMAQSVAPVSLASVQLLPAPPALAGLLPGGGLRRGSVIGVGGTGATSVMLAMVAAASAEGSWCAVVGLPSLGLVAAAQAGVVLERLALVPEPGRQWATVAAALLDALDVVIVRPAGRARPTEARRLAARARERRAVLVALGAWPEGTDVRLSVTGSEWQGLGSGHGHLRARRVEVRLDGRGEASRGRQAALWLPGPDGVHLAVAGGAPGRARPSRDPSRRDRAAG